MTPLNTAKSVASSQLVFDTGVWHLAGTWADQLKWSPKSRQKLMWKKPPWRRRKAWPAPVMQVGCR